MYIKKALENQQINSKNSITRGYLVLGLVISVIGVTHLALWYLFLNDFLSLSLGVILTGFGVALTTASLRSQEASKPVSPSKSQSKNRQLEEIEADKIKVLTELKCRNCNDIEIRDFKRGDYVFKAMTKCPKCASDRYISSIFALPLEDEEDKKTEDAEI